MHATTALEQQRHALADRGIRPGLQTMQRVLEALDVPYRDLPTVLIGGTNGKGSTASLLASMATAARYRVGLFTSPHLQRYEEQMCLDGRPIAAETLLELWNLVLETAERLCPGEITAFEVLTAVAILDACRQAVDLMICEVGMGGQLDCTNVLQPRLSIITSLGLDHAQFLGSTLSEIARHKAGIARPGRPVLVSRIDPVEAELLLVAEVRRLRADARRVRNDVLHLEVQADGDGWQWVHLRTAAQAYDLRLPLAGAHQLSNLATAVRAAEELRVLGWDRLDAQAIQRGTAACRWPGRLETLRLEVEPPKALQAREQTVLLDAAHNVQGAATLAEHLRHLGRDFDLLFGALDDKDARGMLQILCLGATDPPKGEGRATQRLWLTQPSGPRAWDPSTFRVPPPVADYYSIEVVADLAQALDRALGETSALLVISGSLRLVGDARTLLFDRFNPRPLPTRLP